jgi:hypothetical protein
MYNFPYCSVTFAKLSAQGFAAILVLEFPVLFDPAFCPFFKKGTK